MWIIKVALDRPYTFIVLALLILLISPVMILRTPADIFPNINIPVIAVSWTYAGLNPEDMEGRITTVYERVLTTLVDNIEHIESTTVNGTAVVKIFLQPGASLDTANAQVTAASQTILRQLPAGTQPPLIINFSASSVPILQLALSGNGLTESQLNDIALNFLRTQLVTVPGAAIPFPYGGKQRQVMVSLNPQFLQAKGLSPADVVTRGESSEPGTAFRHRQNRPVRIRRRSERRSANRRRAERSAGEGRQRRDDLFARRRAGERWVRSADQHRAPGRKAQRAGHGSQSRATRRPLTSSNGIRKLLPRVATTLPPELKIQPLADQSIFVRAAVNGVIREAIIAACLTGLMILIFLGSWRSTLIIAVSIPLSILTSVIVLGFLHETINVMTLGGLALAVGILVDDATVTIENIERYLEQGRDLRDAILEGAGQIAVPALVSTLCICIVFLPMFFLSGVARYLFVPLAEAVVFAMIASYILSRTLVPTLAMYLLKSKQHMATVAQSAGMVSARIRARIRAAAAGLSASADHAGLPRIHFRPAFFWCVCASAFLLVPWLGQDFFPSTDSGQFILHLRAKTGTRIEETARLVRPGGKFDPSAKSLATEVDGHSRQHRASR